MASEDNSSKAKSKEVVTKKENHHKALIFTDYIFLFAILALLLGDIAIVIYDMMYVSQFS